MKNVVLFLLAVVMVVGIPACNGDDDNGGPPDECIAYCQRACTKFVNCKFIPPQAATVCADGCVDELDKENLESAEACVAAGNFYDVLSCNQLGDLFETFLSAADIGSKLGRSCSQ